MNIYLNDKAYIHKENDSTGEGADRIHVPNFKIHYPNGWSIEKNNSYAKSCGADVAFHNNKYDHSILWRMKSHILITFGSKEGSDLDEILQNTITVGTNKLRSFEIISCSSISQSETEDGLEGRLMCFTHRYIIPTKLRAWSLIKIDEKWQYAIVATTVNRKWKNYEEIFNKSLKSFSVIN